MFSSENASRLTSDAGNSCLQGVEGIGGVSSKSSSVTFKGVDVTSELCFEVIEGILCSVNKVSSVSFGLLSERCDTL